MSNELEDTIYNEGYTAGVQGATQDKNPYSAGTDDALAWRNGHSDGNDDAVSGGM